MYLNKLKIHNFRNISSCDLTPDPKLNLILGDNGSGKTSFIEAIYFLSLGRSFRSSKINHVLSHEQKDFQIYAETLNNKDKTILGMQKSRNGDSIVKLNFEVQKKQSPLTLSLPIQLLNPEGFMLLDAGAQARCKVLDWGAFYNNSHFSKIWAETKRLLKQRNAALKQGYNKKTIQIWDTELIHKAEMLDTFRKSYIEALIPILQKIINSFLERHIIEIEYYRGWSNQSALADILDKNFDYDKRTGMTNYGPHRADIKVKANGIIGQDVLSRGQQKLFVCALKLAQGILFNQINHTPCIYLIDDLPSELDDKHLALFLDQLLKQDSQIFLTSIYSIQNHINEECNRLKISDGIISKVN
ncbi:DNA replication/repair protein RecF [Francisellaceae bacterium]|nr:DNA replication/repair protein RecF [Francisellaceae bacterium]